MVLKKNTKILFAIVGLVILMLIVGINVFNFIDDDNLAVAILYTGDAQGWKDTYSHLKQSLLANMTTTAIDVDNNKIDYKLYDVIYLDASIQYSLNKDKLRDELVRFTTKGGGLFLENQLKDFFNSDFIGATEFVKLNAAPKNISYPEIRHNLKSLQEVIKDFDSIYKGYREYELLKTYDYGYGIKGATGEVLAEENGIALYTVNKVGKGYVFFTNPLLPNYFNINGFSMEASNELQSYFANTTASCNQLLKNQFVAFISKEKYGFSVERVYGNYARPSIAWQLHYEEITGFEHNSARIFSDLAQKHLQIPSYTIIRNSYTWFSRNETVTYLLNEQYDGTLAFTMDEYENAYSSGKHIAADGKWLSIQIVEDGGSYFVDYPEYEQRGYPHIFDYNNDGLLDIIVGSSDGEFYYFEGKKLDENYETAGATKLTDSKGKIISVEGYSAPTMVDINGDNVLDLISGSSDGNIYWFSGNGDLSFDYKGILVKTSLDGQSLPVIGDINNDGVLDLVVGSNNNTILCFYGIYKGSNLRFSTENTIIVKDIDNIEGAWLAPYVVDINKDGINDILAGTFHGYIAKLIGNGNGFEFVGYMEGIEENYKGNRYLKFGNNSVPRLGDLDNDEKLDLIVGSLEYGLAYPIDSKYFPMKNNLAEQINYMKSKGYYVGLHFYTNVGASDGYEKNELAMHKAALELYGIKIIDNIGFNQHTWHTSKHGAAQSIENGFEAGLLWLSGFKPSKSDASPEISAETAISIPFYLESEKNTGIIFNTSTLLYDYKNWGSISAKYDLPVSLYYHCDFAYENTDNTEKDILKAANFTKKYNYNFVTEDQYVKAIVASYNTDFNVSINNKLKKQNIVINTQIKDKNIPLYDENYQKAVGVKIALGEKYLDKAINVDSSVWYHGDNVVYMGVGEKASISIANTSNKDDKFHINRANLPVNIEYSDDGAQVKFLYGGMMQLEVSGDASTDDKDWIITKSENRDATIFTKFGEADTINIKINK